MKMQLYIKRFLYFRLLSAGMSCRLVKTFIINVSDEQQIASSKKNSFCGNQMALQ
jgi:hypothetical protein